MPDLSNLLGAVYGDTSPPKDRDPEDEAHVEREPAASERGPAVPDWADDEHLDEAFAQWKPGPPADASPVERAFVKDADDDDSPPPPLADDLAAALSEALVAASDTADDTAETAIDGRPAPRYDFSADVDEVDEDDDPITEAEPIQAFAPLHPVEEVDEDEDEDAAIDAEPVHAFAPLHPVEEADQDEDPTVYEDPIADAEPLHALAPLHPLPRPVEDPVEPVAAEDHAPEPVELPPHVDVEPEEDYQPSVTGQRAAAAELTAASRIDDVEPLTTPAPAPDPVPTPAPSMPVAVTPMPALSARPAPVPGDGVSAPTTLPAGDRRWERSDDDILPEKQTRKFFSLSLRRG